MSDLANIKELHHRACDEFGSRVHQIKGDQWDLPTPCTDWTVRRLVGHLVHENVWTPETVSGKTIAEVGDRHEGDLLGDDPVAAWEASEDAAIAAVQDVDMADTVHLSFGDVPAGEYASQLFTDYLIHAWDLARAIGADEALDPALVSQCSDWFAEREELYRAAGVISDRIAPPAGADAQTSLLARFGRDATR